MYGIWIVTVSCVVAWRQGAFYTGGLDPVVIIKALLQAGAMCWALTICLVYKNKYPVGAKSLGSLLAILAVSVVGALAEGNLSASAVIAVRVMMMALTAMLLMSRYSAQRVLLGLCTALALVGIFSAVTGLALGGEGRLAGGIPPLSPNEIALLTGVPALVLLHEALRARVHWWHIIALIVLAGGLLLSESRTALIGAACAAGLMVLLMRRLPIQTVSAALLLAPGLFFVVFFTPVVQSIVTREDSASFLTLNSRTISWSVVLNLPMDSWQRWIGEGLSMKTIAVEGQYWDEQVFDSSWISLLAQTGVIGAAIALFWVLSCVFAALKSKKLRSLFIPLLAFVLVRSTMENGLIDAGVTFLVFFTLSLSLEPPSRSVGCDWDRDGHFGVWPTRT
ncbi:O-antigen ligase family protein [Paeniglutamicibacter antarcticus]